MRCSSLILVTALLLSSQAFGQGASVNVDLDGIPMNGDESSVETTVVNSNSPIQIENRITNNAGAGFTFDWPGAGPGGFCSVLRPNVGGGTTWTWQTTLNLYNLNTPIVFTPALEVPVFGQPPGGVQSVGSDLSFTVPGKSIYQNATTPLAEGILVSSLIEFFSPDQTLATCTSNFSPGIYEHLLANESDVPIVVDVVQLNCCEGEDQIQCDDTCVAYFDDPLNCGGCDIECAGEGTCNFGCCSGTSNCNGVCSDLDADPLNCGACGNNCPSDRSCSGGECLCNLGGECGGTCTDLFNDPFNCGACASVCDFSECPTGTGTCSAGECICDFSSTGVADYRFQETLASSVGEVPNLVALDVEVPVYASMTVDDETRTVLTFDEGTGLRLDTAGLIPSDTYTVVMLFQFDTTSYFAKILDFKDRTSDDGLYAHTDVLEYWPIVGGTAALTPNSWVQVAMSRDPSGNVVAYVDGVASFTFEDTLETGVISLENFLHFFRDDVATGDAEHSAGAVARIRLFDEALTAQQVADLDRLPELPAATAVASSPPGRTTGRLAERRAPAASDSSSSPRGFGDFSTMGRRNVRPVGGSWTGVATPFVASRPSSRSEEPARSATTLQRGTPTANSPAGGGEGADCSLIDFEGLPNGGFVGTIEGTPSATFGSSWVALIDEDAGGSGNFGNEPSPSTAVTFLDVEVADPINFDAGVQFVEVFYSAAAVSLPVTLRAWDGPNGTGAVIDTVLGNTVGTDYDGAPCVGDPTGSFCLWSVLQLVSATDNIRSITLDGAEANFFGFDNMTFCTSLPATGACCTGNSCLVTTAANCQSIGGGYQGDEAPCLPDTCGDPFVVGIQDAEICVIPDSETNLLPGQELLISCQEGAVVGREISTQATVISADGSISGQGPCQLIVPFDEFVVGEFEPSPYSMLVYDDSRDYVLQPGEFAELFIEILNLGTEPLIGTAPNPVSAQLISPPDFFNPLPVTLVTDSSNYGDFEPLPAPKGCGQKTIFNPVTNDVPYALILDPNQTVDVTRQLTLIFSGTVPGSGPITKELALTLGVGKPCDPVAGPPYDGIAGLGGVVDAELAPDDYPLNLSSGSFGVGDTIALELELFCGASPSDPSTFDLLPHIVSIRHETDGEIVGDVIPNIDDRFFSCSSNCTFDLDTTLIPAGQVVIGVAMPDSKRYQAGLTLAP